MYLRKVAESERAPPSPVRGSLRIFESMRVPSICGKLPDACHDRARPWHAWQRAMDGLTSEGDKR